MCIIVIWVAVGGVLCGGSIRVVERMGHIIKCYLASGDKHTSYSPLSGSYISPTNILIQSKFNTFPLLVTNKNFESENIPIIFIDKSNDSYNFLLTLGV